MMCNGDVVIRSLTLMPTGAKQIGAEILWPNSSVVVSLALVSTSILGTIRCLKKRGAVKTHNGADYSFAVTRTDRKLRDATTSGFSLISCAGESRSPSLFAL